MFRNGISKNTRSSYKGTIKYGTPLSSSDSEMASKVKKNLRSLFEKKKIHCYYLKTQDYELFKNMSKIPVFVLRPLESMLNF